MQLYNALEVGLTYFTLCIQVYLSIFQVEKGRVALCVKSPTLNFWINCLPWQHRATSQKVEPMKSLMTSSSGDLVCDASLRCLKTRLTSLTICYSATKLLTIITREGSVVRAKKQPLKGNPDRARNPVVHG